VPRLQRAATHLALALLVVAAWVFVVALMRESAPLFLTGSGCPSCTGTFYGANTTLTIGAIQHIWPQGATANCGVDTAEAVVNYADELAGVPMRFTDTQDMLEVDQANQSTATASQWGHATPVNQVGGYTNIAADAGTDPRSIAYMTWYYRPTTQYYHDYVYRWTSFHSTQPLYSTQAREATTSLAESLERWSLPVNVTINGGMHSVLVTGVWSSNDPQRYYPAGIQGLVFRDPEYAAASSRFEVDFSSWAWTGLYMGNYHYSLWGIYYGDLNARGDHLNTKDPEPLVGPYTPQPSKNEPYHWFDGFTWIQRDTFSGAASPDWAFTAETPSSLGKQMTSP
jgi:hypothetical protein